MSGKHQILLILILISLVASVYRTFVTGYKEYGAADAVGLVIEGPIWVWLLVTG